MKKEFITAVLLENVQLVNVAVPLLYIAPPCIYHAISGPTVEFHEASMKEERIVNHSQSSWLVSRSVGQYDSFISVQHNRDTK